jgi:hypothetical protein
MAAPQPPQLTLFPDPPLLTDDEDTYNARADDTVIAQQKFIPEINYAPTWIGQQVTAVDGYRQAAATSAGNAADSASAANSSKNAAAQSAIDATNNGKAQVQLAQQAAAAAQAAAQAAGAAAGLPGGRVPFTVLQVNSAGNVSWGDGLIDKASALPGQALMLGAGKVPKWDYPGLRVGDILQTAKNPGALYLPASGGVYLQSAYPALFAVLGLIANPAGQVWSADTVNNLSAGGLETDGKGVWLRGSKRSTDDAVTWVNGGTSADVYGNDGKGVWIAGTTGVWRRSTDNGATFTEVWRASTIGTGYPSYGAKTDGNGTWIAHGYIGLPRRSTDNGVTWTEITTSVTQIGGVLFLGNNVWINNRGQRSTDNGATWATYGQVLNAAGTGAVPMKLLANGEIIAASSDSIMKSFNGGLTWQPKVSFSNCQSIATDNSGKIVAVNGASQVYMVSQDNGETWQSQTAVGNTQPASVAYGTNKFISNGTQGNGVAKSTESFDYDKATQFKVPNPYKNSNLQNYIKAFEVAA